MIQPESLPDGFSKSPEAGPGYDLHDDGTVARLYCRVDGEIRGWVVELEKGQCRGTAQRVRADQVNFPEDYDEDAEAPEAEADEDSSALFAEWISGYADDVAREVDADQFLTCAFCKLRENEVETMIAGPEASICNECVAQCAVILTAEDENSGDQPTEEAPAD